jgi:hypothetical protein
VGGGKLMQQSKEDTAQNERKFNRGSSPGERKELKKVEKSRSSPLKELRDCGRKAHIMERTEKLVRRLIITSMIL